MTTYTYGDFEPRTYPSSVGDVEAGGGYEADENPDVLRFTEGPATQPVVLAKGSATPAPWQAPAPAPEPDATPADD